LQGCSDQRLYEICRDGQRCLITLDLDFSDVTHFPPAATGGIVIIRIPGNPSLALLGQLVVQFLNALSRFPIEGKLWIVEVGRIRMHESEGEEGSAAV
jgi:predicted nuclease of predicted toxin-antitoxin system